MGKLEWEIKNIVTGVTWHDRRRDEECTRIEIATPYGTEEAADWRKAQELVQGSLGQFLGDMSRKPNKETRNLVFKRKVSNFDFQYVFRQSRWLVTFKTVEDVPVADLQAVLDQLNSNL